MREVLAYKYIPPNKEGKIEYHCFAMFNKLMSLGINHQLKGRQPSIICLPIEKHMTKDKIVLQEQNKKEPKFDQTTISN